jgi:TRAP-type mannitol/chloroaromatic compound transport system substrate-binding protein
VAHVHSWNNRALDVHQTAEKLAKVVEEMTAGRFRIEVFPGDQIMKPLECFDAASKGTIDAFMSAPFYWADKEPAVQWFHTIPFGMNPEGMSAWLYQGDGLKLMEETYAAFNLVPRPSGAQAPQMGGWFRKKLATLADFKGLRIRIGPLGGKVLARAGATVTLIPAADIYAALERGVIDASEWVGPADDMQLGLHKTARYYYYPGWHEPGSTNEFGFNKRAYEAIARSQEAGRGDHSRGVRKDSSGEKGARLVHDVPGAGGPVGSHRRGRLPSARRGSVVIQRRRFLAKVSGATAAATAATIIDAPSVIAQPKIQWRMSTAWTPALDHLQGVAQRLAKIVEESTAGRFRIEVFPGGQIMQPLDCFEAVSKGTIEAFMATPAYWTAREPAMEWFNAIPFGMNAEGMAAWFHQGDGLKLWEETYAPFNLVPRPGVSPAPQMAGWFRAKINTIGDYKGLKMRIASGLGGKVYVKAGGSAVLIPGAGIFAALERGVIDAAEWIGPHDDLKLGLQNTARHYYYPGWHEPGATAEFGFNKKAYESLPVDLRRTLDHAVAAGEVYGLADYHAKNAIALEKLKTEYKGKVEILQVPAPVLRDLKKLAAEVVREESEKTPLARKVHASYAKFQALVGPWDHVAEGAYHQLVAGTS